MALSKKNTRLLAVELLSANENEGAYINHLIEKSQGFNALSALDRALCLEIVYGVLRNKRHLDAIIKNYVTRGYASFQTELKNILRTAVYQFQFLEKIPDYAILSESVELAKKIVSLRYARLVNGVLRNYQRIPYKVAKPDGTSLNALAEYYSHPDWIVKRFIKQFSRNNLQPFLAANNQVQPIYLRRLKEVELHPSISDFLQPVPEFHVYFQLRNHMVLDKIPGWQDGVFCVQDPGSGLAVELLAPQEGETAIDLCAAPGGKTMALASLVGKHGHVFAVESVKKRIGVLKKNIDTLDEANVEIILDDARKINLKPADAVLVDAPCSGLGVLARRADLRWQRKPYDLKPLVQLQKEILANAVKLVKPGGRLIYSTCTIDKAENEEVVADFLDKNSHFSLANANQYIDRKYVTAEGFVRTWPHKHHIDGSFSARLVKNKT